MSVGQLAYLTLVLCGFGLFLSVVGSVSAWVSPPWRRKEPTRPVQTVLSPETAPEPPRKAA